MIGIVDYDAFGPVPTSKEMKELAKVKEENAKIASLDKQRAMIGFRTEEELDRIADAAFDGGQGPVACSRGLSPSNMENSFSVGRPSAVAYAQEAGFRRCLVWREPPGSERKVSMAVQTATPTTVDTAVGDGVAVSSLLPRAQDLDVQLPSVEQVRQSMDAGALIALQSRLASLLNRLQLEIGTCLEDERKRNAWVQQQQEASKDEDGAGKQPTVMTSVEWNQRMVSRLAARVSDDPHRSSLINKKSATVSRSIVRSHSSGQRRGKNVGDTKSTSSNVTRSSTATKSSTSSRGGGSKSPPRPTSRPMQR